ncbi:MAG: RIP metalloprotease RseP [bacterium]|nr:RIP metalloprotease RseP [bacterium]
MMALTYIIGIVVLLGLCIFVHELGHLLGGKMVGIKAKVFSMGYGKGVLKKKIGETTYQVTLIPFGGYCQFYGEEPSEEREGKSYEFLTAAPWRRIVTVAMGPLFNLIFGIIIFFMMNLVGYSKATNKVFIPKELIAEKKSVAYEAGIRTGDEILEIDGKKITGFSDISYKIFFSEGKKLDFKVKQGDKIVHKDIKPKFNKIVERYSVGIAPNGKGPLIGKVISGTPAAKEGLRKLDKVISIDDGISEKEVKSHQEFIDIINERPEQEVTLKLERKGKEMSVRIKPDPKDVIVMEDILKKTLEGNTGQKSGEKSDEKTAKAIKEIKFSNVKSIKDTIKEKKVAINGTVVSDYAQLLAAVRDNGEAGIVLRIWQFIYEKDEEVEREIEYTGKAQVKRIGQIGVNLSQTPAPYMVEIKLGVSESFTRAFVEPYEFIVMQLKGMKMLFSGKMSVRKNLGGPIKIAVIAGDVLYLQGVSEFILLIAKISIILMIMNLLPIPVVDGGHLVFYSLEMVRGKPLSQDLMERIQTVGVIFLIGLFILIMGNDIFTLVSEWLK